MSNSVNTNYGGRQPNNTAYIKNFFYGAPAALWKTIWGTTITPASPTYPNVYVPGNIIVGGHIFRRTFSPSDNTSSISETNLNELVAVSAESTYGFTYDSAAATFPSLMQHYDMDYCSLIPLLVHKIQQLETRLNEIEH